MPFQLGKVQCHIHKTTSAIVLSTCQLNFTTYFVRNYVVMFADINCTTDVYLYCFKANYLTTVSSWRRERFQFSRLIAHKWKSRLRFIGKTNKYKNHWYKINSMRIFYYLNCKILWLLSERNDPISMLGNNNSFVFNLYERYCYSFIWFLRGTWFGDTFRNIKRAFGQVYQSKMSFLLLVEEAF